MEEELDPPSFRFWKTHKFFYGLFISVAFYSCYASVSDVPIQEADTSDLNDVRLVTDIYFRWSENRSSSSIAESGSGLHIDTQLSIISQTKKILIVAPLRGYRFVNGRAGFINSGCPVSNCIITSNRSQIPNFDVDAFIVQLPNRLKPWKPKKRRTDQVFVFFSTEPPPQVPSLKMFDGYFNRTMTYMSKSDFYLPYGRIDPLTSAPKTDTDRYIMMQDIRNSNANPAVGKKKMVAWMVSDCQAQSNREVYVKLLQKYVSVDIISNNGRCGGKDLCPKSKNDDVCYDMIENTYKFYLAFENSICNEYVSEKFFNVISRNIVPVVLGGANYSAIAPKHSYINAMDYTPKQLAQYLKELDKHDSMYAEYFWWKPHYRVVNLRQTNEEAFCQLCAALHSKPIVSKTIDDFQKWFVDESRCKRNLTYLPD